MTYIAALLFIIGLALAGADPIEAQPMSLWQLAVNLTGLLMFFVALWMASHIKNGFNTRR